MDGLPGVIVSDDDFGVNAAGIMITETTITQFEGWDPAGKPEFARARKALQYRRLCQRLADRRQQDLRNRAFRAGTQEPSPRANPRRLLLRRQLSRHRQGEQGRDPVRSHQERFLAQRP
jgi:hypothetical protein